MCCIDNVVHCVAYSELSTLTLLHLGFITKLFVFSAQLNTVSAPFVSASYQWLFIPIALFGARHCALQHR